MADIGGFTPSKNPPGPKGSGDRQFAPLPAGQYLAMITDSQNLKTHTDKGEGYWLELTLLVCDGEYENRLFWDKILLSHPTEKAVEIGREKLNAIAHATKVLNPRGSEDFYSKPLYAHLTVDGKYNRVQYYESPDAKPEPSAPGRTDGVREEQESWEAGDDSIPF